ncbi:Fatty acid oxidation complex subunit alpha [Sphingobium sp. S6]|nr:Fatty acid oxidation complex subunit alpha [Sphingobium sp. S8]CAD7339022.1 Fatty acid oxidation complex subunit alpha [Sphingobium sp. S6]
MTGNPNHLAMRADMTVDMITDYMIEDGVAVITTDYPPVNALSHAVMSGMVSALERVYADDDVRAIVIACAGRTFHAGADITAMGKPREWPELRDLQGVVERSPKPVVAAIHGTTLGGGLELALVAHARVAAETTRVGLPEVKLGIVPGAGGTQRLTHIAGPELALDLVTSGRQIGADEALKAGLVDAVVADSELRAQAVSLAKDLAARDGMPRSDGKARDFPAEEAAGLFERYRQINARKYRGFKAPEYAVRCVEAAMSLPLREGLKAERALYEDLRDGDQALAQRHIFLAERQATKLRPDLAGSRTRPIETVAVIGAGTMGGGIAMNFLSAGIPVVLIERESEALERGVATIRRNYERGISSGRVTAEGIDAAMALLRATTRIEDVAVCDLIIEAVFENIAVKREVFETLDRVARNDAILATNTSYLNLDEIAGFTARPENVVGMHFFSPANIMRLLEIVRGARTAPDVLATVVGLSRRIGKVGVIVGNCFGFVGNRMLAQRQKEAEKLLLEGAMPWDVDRVLYDFGFPMGPFQMRDLAGNDVGWNRETSSSSTVREILNERGRLGQKAGKGYYDYDAGGKPVPSGEVKDIILKLAERKGITRREIGEREIFERCLYPMVNEGARILEEGKALRASDVDVVWVTGYGWPAYRGGPLYWAGQEGIGRIVERLRALAPLLGDEFMLSPLLAQLGSEGSNFYSFDSGKGQA